MPRDSVQFQPSSGVEWRYLTPLRVLHMETGATFVCWAGEWRMEHSCWCEFIKRHDQDAHLARSRVFRLELECALWVHGREPEQRMETKQVA